MLTGDNETTAQAVARRLGIDEVEAEILPQDKAKVVARRRKEGRIVAMADDGVNDAPALGGRSPPVHSIRRSASCCRRSSLQPPWRSPR